VNRWGQRVDVGHDHRAWQAQRSQRGPERLYDVGRLERLALAHTPAETAAQQQWQIPRRQARHGPHHGDIAFGDGFASPHRPAGVETAAAGGNVGHLGRLAHLVAAAKGEARLFERRHQRPELGRRAGYGAIDGLVVALEHQMTFVDAGAQRQRRERRIQVGTVVRQAHGDTKCVRKRGDGA
jgi:hypothetical protein